MNFWLILTGIGAAVWLVLSNEKDVAAAPASPALAPKPSPGAATVSVAERVAQALAAGPEACLALAKELEAAGLTQQAADLRAAAAKMTGNSPVSVAPVYGSVSPGFVQTAPSVAAPVAPIYASAPVVPAAAVPAQTGSALFRDADVLAAHLRNVKKYKENKALVTDFQRKAGLKPDGLYGPKTAVAVASAGVIPPKPFYWAKATWANDKAQYQADMLRFSQQDPQRAAAWIAAGKVS